MSRIWAPLGLCLSDINILPGVSRCQLAPTSHSHRHGFPRLTLRPVSSCCPVVPLSATASWLFLGHPSSAFLQFLSWGPGPGVEDGRCEGVSWAVAALLPLGSTLCWLGCPQCLPPGTQDPEWTSLVHAGPVTSQHFSLPKPPQVSLRNSGSRWVLLLPASRRPCTGWAVFSLDSAYAQTLFPT